VLTGPGTTDPRVWKLQESQSFLPGVVAPRRHDRVRPEARAAVGPQPLAVADRDRESLVSLEGLDHHAGGRRVSFLNDLGEAVRLECHEQGVEARGAGAHDKHESRRARGLATQRSGADHLQAGLPGPQPAAGAAGDALHHVEPVAQEACWGERDVAVQQVRCALDDRILETPSGRPPGWAAQVEHDPLEPARLCESRAELGPQVRIRLEHGVVARCEGRKKSDDPQPGLFTRAA